ncbi:MAG: hypothetical protein COV66_06125 [Nitrospinae bacterium CG11_big_fil_rev_8_21_14_0_20_45_15]|nr:MAG: hypothetical protein COV66_06125 [Nitrospinae bacterium CG11_big_fil_rev_8_21_14_0_20_45_15]
MFFTFKKKLKTIFLTGMLITLPIALTLFILKFLFRNLDALSPTFTQLLIQMGAPIPEGYRIPFLGVFMTLFIIFLIGVFVNNIFGKQLVLLGETIVQKIPFFRRIYSGSKQIVSSFTSVDTKSFNQVVLIEFPRRGVYALGFVTSETRGEIQKKTADNVLNVFVPTTPNPTSGFLIFSPAEELLPLMMTIEEGVKYVISGGIVDPIATKEFLKKQDAN